MDHICQFVNGNYYCDSNDKRYKAKLHRKIHQTKKKVKPKLTSEEKGWHKLNYTNTLNLSSKEINENIVCVDRNILTAQEFREKFEIKTSTPVIMLNDQKYWLAHKKWKLSRLKLKYRNQLFRCGNDENGFSVKIKLRYFIDYLLCNTDDAPLYIFDGSIKNNTKSSRLLEDYIISDYFNEDLFSILGDEKRPPFRWFVMVPPRSGTNIHLDPLGGKVSVPGIYGDITVDIPKASNSRGRIRLPGKGIARVNSFGYGDHYLYLSIAAPRRLTNVQRAISDGVEIVVATPGRLSDLVASGVFALNNCRFLVLDECVVLLAADNKQMLTELHTALPKVGPSGERLQVIVCSATLHSFEVNKLADAIMQFPQWVDLKGEDSVPDTVHHLVCMVDPTADKSWQTRLSSDARFLDGVYAEDRLSQAIENRELQLGQLERQWADHKAELTGHIATVRAGRLAGMARTRQLEERLGEVRGQIDECRADYQQEAEIGVLDDKVKHVLTTCTQSGGGSTAQSRGDFTKGILELTEYRKADGGGKVNSFESELQIFKLFLLIKEGNWDRAITFVHLFCDHRTIRTEAMEKLMKTGIAVRKTENCYKADTRRKQCVVCTGPNFVVRPRRKVGVLEFVGLQRCRGRLAWVTDCASRWLSLSNMCVCVCYFFMFLGQVRDI